MVRRALAVLTLAAGIAPLYGATLQRLSLDDMIAKSTAIVRGRVTHSYAAFSGSSIFTHYRLQVLERWKGPDQSSLEVFVPGGTVGGLREVVGGVPQLVTGDDYVLFLWTGKSGRTQVIGFTQGVFELAKTGGGGAIAAQAATPVTALDPKTGQVVNDLGIQMPLSDLVARIQAVLGTSQTK